MLPIAIELNRNIIAIFPGVKVARLHRSPNAEIEWEANDQHISLLGCQSCVVSRTIIDNEDIRIGHMITKVLNDPRQAFLLIIGRNDNECLHNFSL